MHRANQADLTDFARGNGGASRNYSRDCALNMRGLDTNPAPTRSPRRCQKEGAAQPPRLRQKALIDGSWAAFGDGLVRDRHFASTAPAQLPSGARPQIWSPPGPFLRPWLTLTPLLVSRTHCLAPRLAHQRDLPSWAAEIHLTVRRLARIVGGFLELVERNESLRPARGSDFN